MEKNLSTMEIPETDFKSVTFTSSEFGLPPNYPQVLMDFAREVIRSQPTNIYEFGKEYFNCKRMVGQMDFKNLIGCKKKRKYANYFTKYSSSHARKQRMCTAVYRAFPFTSHKGGMRGKPCRNLASNSVNTSGIIQHWPPL